MEHRRDPQTGRYEHEYYWVPAEYGLRPANPADAEAFLAEGEKSNGFVAGELCYTCGKWLGPKLARGEAKRFLKLQMTVWV